MQDQTPGAPSFVISPYSLTERVDVPVLGAGPMPVYVARPEPGATRGSVVVGMELFGVTSHVRDVCDRLASLGYVAVAPDLYHHVAPGTELAADDAGRAQGFELLARLTRADVLRDVDATLDWTSHRHGPVVGMVGLSLGGHIAYLAATRFALPRVAIFYGGWLPTTDISLSRPEPTIALTDRIVGRVQMFTGDKDAVVPPSQRQAIDDALSDAGVEHDVVSYPEVGHGFLCDRRPGYDHEAATDAWRRLEDFLASA